MLPARRGAQRRLVTSFAAFLVLAIALVGSPAHAKLKLQLGDPAAPPSYVPPGAQVATTPAPAKESSSVTGKWWFWAAVGGVVVTTVVVVLIAGRSPSPPSSTLGNMDAFKGQGG